MDSSSAICRQNYGDGCSPTDSICPRAVFLQGLYLDGNAAALPLAMLLLRSKAIGGSEAG